MRFFRVGNKVISREKLYEMITEILSERERGATQEQTARTHGVQRSFVSFLESLGEVRRGPRVAVVGFPVKNVEEVEEVAEKYAVEFTLLLSQTERESFAEGSAGELLNLALETMAELVDYDVIVLMGSDYRVELFEKILGRPVVPITLGASPITKDQVIDVAELETVLEGVTAPKRAASGKRAAGGKRAATGKRKKPSRTKRVAERIRGGTEGRWKLSSR
jgi:hypothetical protein